MRRAFLVVLAIVSCQFAAAGAFGGEDPAQAMARRMGRGLNILGYDGLWDGGVDAPFRKSDFGLIQRAGFSNVRINLHAFRHMNAADRLDPLFLQRAEWAARGAIKAGLIPVVDEHDFSDCQADPDVCGRRLRAFWREMSVHFAGRMPELVFELLNEPGGSMSAQSWNALLADLLVIIRAGNPDRTVVVPTLNLDDIRTIDALVLPERDRNLIVTVHYYKPMRFTHQGAPWADEFSQVRDQDWGTRADEDAVRRDLDVVKAWSDRRGRPIYLGEFGVYDAAGLPRRARWMAFLAREAERRGWPWAAWQFDHDFAVYDGRAWRRPLLEALVPVGSDRPGAGRR